MLNWVFAQYIFDVHKYCIWLFTVVYIVGQIYFHNIKFTGNIHSFLHQDPVFDIPSVSSSKMVLPLKDCEHSCASCRICRSVVLVTLCFYPDKLVLTLKFIKKKAFVLFLITVVLQVVTEETEPGMNQSCSVNCSYFTVAYIICIHSLLWKTDFKSNSCACFCTALQIPGEACFWNCPSWTFTKSHLPISLF